MKTENIKKWVVVDRDLIADAKQRFTDQDCMRKEFSEAAAMALWSNSILQAIEELMGAEQEAAK